MAPRGGWVRSNVTEQKIERYIETGLLPPASEGRWRIPGEETVPDPRPGESICFLSHLARGLSTPYSTFFIRFLAFYNICLYDLPPNSLLAISCYVSYCEAFLGCPPNFPLWLSLYCGKALPAKGEDLGDIQVTGGVVFLARPDISDIFPPIEPKKKVTRWKES